MTSYGTGTLSRSYALFVARTYTKQSNAKLESDEEIDLPIIKHHKQPKITNPHIGLENRNCKRKTTYGTF